MVQIISIVRSLHPANQFLSSAVFFLFQVYCFVSVKLTKNCLVTLAIKHNKKSDRSDWKMGCSICKFGGEF